MFQRLLPFFLVAAHGTLWAVSALTLGKLTTPYPTHFDAGGQPDAWSDGSWWLLPLIGLFVAIIFFLVVPLVRRLAATSPQWVNMPRKRDWVALPLDGRLRSLRAAEGLVLGVALFTNLFLVSVVLDSYAIATGVQTSMSMMKIGVIIATMAVWTVLSVLRIRQAVGDEVRLARKNAETTPS